MALVSARAQGSTDGKDEGTNRRPRASQGARAAPASRSPPSAARDAESRLYLAISPSVSLLNKYHSDE